MTQQQIKHRPRKRRDAETVTEAPATRPDHAKRASRGARVTVSKIDRALAGK